MGTDSQVFEMPPLAVGGDMRRLLYIRFHFFAEPLPVGGRQRRVVPAPVERAIAICPGFEEKNRGQKIVLSQHP